MKTGKARRTVKVLAADDSLREAYEKPAIIYEGRLTVRAGSPNAFTGEPFNLFGKSLPPDEG